MGMIIALHLMATMGLMGWGVTLYYGLTLQGPERLRAHLLWALGSVLWNLFAQSMLLFMWLSLTRQIRQHAERQGANFYGPARDLIRVRNRLFPWIAFSLPVWMIPLFTGMARLFGWPLFSGVALPMVHAISAWIITGYALILVVTEWMGMSRLLYALRTAQAGTSAQQPVTKPDQ